MKKEESGKLRELYAKQIAAKDKLIAELKKEREALLATSIKQSKRAAEWQRIAEELAKKNRS